MPVEQDIRKLAKEYSHRLKNKIDNRVTEMEQDNSEHFLIYQVLGVTYFDSKLIDIYQSRFLYKYAGAFLCELPNFVLLLGFQSQARLKYLTHKDNVLKPSR
jgi:hypothetical protein